MKPVTATAKTFATAWDAITDTPEEAAVLKARADLMIALADHIKTQGWTQAEAAKRLASSTWSAWITWR